MIQEKFIILRSLFKFSFTFSLSIFNLERDFFTDFYYELIGISYVNNPSKQVARRVNE